MDTSILNTNQNKPRVRVRPNLTSFQISDQQKVVIDQAYEKFRASSEINATKGEFVEALCMNFLRGKGGAVTDASVPPEVDDTSEDMVDNSSVIS